MWGLWSVLVSRIQGMTHRLGKGAWTERGLCRGIWTHWAWCIWGPAAGMFVLPSLCSCYHPCYHLYQYPPPKINRHKMVFSSQKFLSSVKDIIYWRNSCHQKNSLFVLCCADLGCANVNIGFYTLGFFFFFKSLPNFFKDKFLEISFFH